MQHSLEVVDKSLLRKPGEEEIFNTPYEHKAGAGNFTSLKAAQRMIPTLNFLEFRITVDKDSIGDSYMATIWVKKEQYLEFQKLQKEEANKKSMRDFWKISPILIGAIIILALLFGILGAWYVWVNKTIYGFETAKPLLAFVINAGIVLIVGLFCFIFWILNKGRPN
jgi:hypothetical protein